LVIGLPVPPGVVVEGQAGEKAYLALRFGVKGQRPPPVILTDLATDEPRLAAGIVVFDAWVGNTDRHPENLAYVKDTMPVVIFDHERALLGDKRANAETRIANPAAAPPVTGPLVSLVTNAGHVVDWCDRIARLPLDFILDVCREAEMLTELEHSLAEKAVTFLDDRRKHLPVILKPAMPQIAQWSIQ
jgi:hypothetical protein